MTGWLRNTPRVQWLWGHVTREVPVTHHARGHQVAISEAWMGTHLGVLSVERAPCHSRERRNLENSASIPTKEHDRGPQNGLQSPQPRWRTRFPLYLLQKREPNCSSFPNSEKD